MWYIFQLHARGLHTVNISDWRCMLRLTWNCLGQNWMQCKQFYSQVLCQSTFLVHWVPTILHFLGGLCGSVVPHKDNIWEWWVVGVGGRMHQSAPPAAWVLLYVPWLLSRPPVYVLLPMKVLLPAKMLLPVKLPPSLLFSVLLTCFICSMIIRLRLFILNV